MAPLPAFSPPADGLFERIACRAVLEGGVQPAQLAPDVLVGTANGQPGRVAIVRDSPVFRAQVDALIRAHKGFGIEVIVVGGGEETRARLKDALPTFTGAGVLLRHVTDSAEPAEFGKTRGFRAWLAAPHPAPDWTAFWNAIKERGAGDSAFAAGVRIRGTPATIVLLVVNLAMYGVELALGAPDSTLALARLGALMRDRVLAGEVWRMVTSTFLHGSVPHLAFNMLVLFSLGRSLERILGTSRFLLLYSAAAIGGSMVSLLFTGEFSVGASGALWGLMTAQMALALRGAGILPEDLRARMQSGAMQNLALNVMNSFRPGVDWAAHAGGGLVGGLLGVVGLLTLGLPRWASVKAGEEAPPDRVPAFVHVLAALGGLTLAVGLGAGLVLGGAFAIGRPPQLRSTPIGATGFTADVPDALAPNPGDAESGDQSFGDVSLDPALVDIIVQTPDVLLTEAGREQLYTQIDDALAANADGFTRRGPNPRLDRVNAGGVVVLKGEYDGPNGFRLERAVVVREDAMIRVEELYRADGDASWHGLAQTIALSARGPGVGR